MNLLFSTLSKHVLPSTMAGEGRSETRAAEFARVFAISTPLLSAEKSVVCPDLWWGMTGNGVKKYPIHRDDLPLLGDVYYPLCAV
jgi:hypothetical protein